MGRGAWGMGQATGRPRGVVAQGVRNSFRFSVFILNISLEFILVQRGARGMGHFQVECNALLGCNVQPYAAKVLKIALPWALHVARRHWPQIPDTNVSAPAASAASAAES